MTWYLAVALGLTGHTKIIWGARKVKDKLDIVGAHTGYVSGNTVGQSDGKSK